MPQEQLFRLRAGVHCADGHCGTVKTLVIDPGEDAVTHLVVEPAHRHHQGKLVPLRLVDTQDGNADSGEVRLRCTMAEFADLDPAEGPFLFRGDEDYASHGREPLAAAWP